MPFLSTFVCVSLLLLRASAVGPSAELYIANANVAPDGFTRSAVLAGSAANQVTFPGPLITGNKGATFNLNVNDQLTDQTMLRSTSIHWHGIFQAGSSWADGPAGVTQCPIAPGNSFLYTFTGAQQTGTYWYHSHYATQYCDGLRGVLVIYDPHDPYKPLYQVDDATTVITLADWYHTPAKGQVILTPDATLINGLGRYQGGPNATLAIVNVRRFVRYRFRLVSISCDPNYVFSIDHHTMTIIEADGVLTDPLIVDSIQIFAGQRYSFILFANQPVANYWIRANPDLGNTGFAGGINSAILKYQGAPANQDPTTTQTPNSNPLLEQHLHPLNPLDLVPGKPHVGGADVSINLDIQFNFTDLLFTINGASFIPPTVPVLLQILSGARTAQELLPPGDVYVLPSNKVIEVSIPGGQGVGFPHPFHLHGHNFHVIRSANSSTYNFLNPVVRDVVSTGSSTSDNVTFRFVTNNPGPWILHCHIDWHINLGLAIVFAENVTAIAASHQPPAWDQLCPIFDALPPSEL